MPTVAEQIIARRRGASSGGGLVAESIIARRKQPNLSAPGYAEDLGPGAGLRDAPLRAGPAPFGPTDLRPKPGPLVGLSDRLFNAFGFEQMSDEERDRLGLDPASQVTQNLVTGAVRGGVQFPLSVVDDYLKSVVSGSPGPLVEQAKGLVTFVPEQAGKVLQALGLSVDTETDQPARMGSQGNLDPTARDVSRPDPEATARARKELRLHPEGPLFAALLARGGAKAAAKRARPTPTDVGTHTTTIEGTTEPIPTITRREPFRPAQNTPPDIAPPADFPVSEPGRPTLPKREPVGTKRGPSGDQVLPKSEPQPRLNLKHREEYKTLDEYIADRERIGNHFAKEVGYPLTEAELRAEGAKYASGEEFMLALEKKYEAIPKDKQPLVTQWNLNADGLRDYMPRGLDTPIFSDSPVSPPKPIQEKVVGTETKPIVSEPVVEPPPPSAPVVEKAGTAPEPKTIALKKEEIGRLRSELELDALEPPKRRKWVEELDRAKEAKLDEQALTIANDVIAKPRALSTQEHAGLTLKAAERMNEYERALKDHAELLDKGDNAAAETVRSRAEAILREIDVLTEAADYAGREAGRALSIRRMALNRENYRLANVVRRAEAAHGGKLPAPKIKEFERLTAEHEALKRRFEEQESKYHAELDALEKQIAERNLKREVTLERIAVKAKKRREKLAEEKSDVLKQLADLGFRLNDATGVTIEGAYLVGRLATIYIREGATTLAEVTQRVIAQLPELTERDVIKAIAAKQGSRQAKARSEVTQRVAQIKREARLREKIARAEEGIFDPARKRPPTPKDIRELQRQYRELKKEAYKSQRDADKLTRALQRISELEDMLANQYRALRKRQAPESADLKAAREKAREIQKEMRAEDELARLEDQLRTGEFEVRDPEPVKPESPELQRLRVAVKRKRREINTKIENLKPLTPKKVIFEGQNFFRTVLATADMSSTLRQGLLANLSLATKHPQAIPRTFVNAFKAFFDQNKAEAIDAAIRGHENHYLREKAGLELTEIGSDRLTLREEKFMSRIAESIPGFGRVVRASERHMTTNLNMLRTAMFDWFLEKHPNATAVELRAWADYINKASGRGSLNSFSNAGVALSTVFFAPKFAVSRFQTPVALFKHWKQPRVRKQIAKDYATFATAGVTALWLADMAGLDVGVDPESPDFGKIKVGNTRFDLFAGFQQPARALTRIGLEAADPEPARWGQSSVDILMQFTKYKLSPTVTIGNELISGRNVIGQEVTPAETAVDALIPLVYQDIREAYKDGGFGRAALSGSAAFFGVGVNTYESKDKSRAGSDGRETRSTLKRKLPDRQRGR